MQKRHALLVNVEKNDHVYIWDHLKVIQNGKVGVESDEENYTNTCLCMKMCVWECVIKFMYVNRSRLHFLVPIMLKNKLHLHQQRWGFVGES